MDIISSNPDCIGSDDNDVVNVILWSGGRISDRSGNEPRYSGGLNMFQKVSKSMSVVDFTKMVHHLFRLNPAKRYKIYSKVFISVGACCFVDISNCSTVADLVNKELHELTSNFSFFTEEVISEDDLSASEFNASTIASRCSFKGSNSPLPLVTRCNVTPLIGDPVICKGGGPSSCGDVVMSKAGGGGLCDKQARLSIQSPMETCDAPAKSAVFPQEGNAPLLPGEQTDTMFLQSGGCIQSSEQTDRSISTLVSGVTSSSSGFGSMDGLGQLPDWCRIAADILIRPLEDVPDNRHEHHVVGEMFSNEIPDSTVDSGQVAGDISESETDDDDADLHLDDTHSLASLNPGVATITEDDCVNISKLGTLCEVNPSATAVNVPQPLTTSMIEVGQHNLPASTVRDKGSVICRSQSSVGPSTITTVSAYKDPTGVVRPGNHLVVGQSSEAYDEDYSNSLDKIDSMNPVGYVERMFNGLPTRFSDLKAGMLFPNREVLVYAIQEVHIRCLREYRVVCPRRKRMVLKCKNESKGCQWKLGASLVGPGPSIYITECAEDHSCGVHRRHNRNGHAMATVNWIALQLRSFVLKKVELSTTGIIEMIQKYYNITISKSKAQRGKRKAVEYVYGSHAESFSVLPKLAAAMVRAGNGCQTDIVVLPPNRKFAAFFWSFGPAVKSCMENLRPVIIIDGTHLRGPYKGTLLVACAQDADNGIVQLAYAIVESEIRGNCGYFLTQLQKHVLSGYRRLSELVVVTDKGTGLGQALGDVLPTVTHVFCVPHFIENFYTKFIDDSVRGSIWIAATTALRSTFDYHMGLIAEAVPGGADWLRETPTEKWTQVDCPVSRWGIFTSNPCESTNSALRLARSLPVAALVQESREMAAISRAQRNEMSKTRNKSITREPAKKLVLIVEKSRCCIPVAYGNNKFEVNHLGALFSVDLNAKSCSCKQYQTAGIPCIHATSAITMKGLVLHDYVYDFYSMDNYRRTYAQTFTPLQGHREWPADPNCDYFVPPDWKNPGGRPKKKRKESQSILVRRSVQCSNCRCYGHNKTGCRNPPFPRPTRN